jgi:aspartyl-tRNA(Asn)/glutamyl-tRNA(Gln) amidotransferase subunit B
VAAVGRFQGRLRHVDNFVGFLTQGTTLRMFTRHRLLGQKLVHRAFHDLRPYQEDPRWPGWQVIVGIETHAQIKSRRKLFSGIRLACSLFCRDLTRSTEGLTGNLEDVPNTHVAPFDAAYPGTLPV